MAGLGLILAMVNWEVNFHNRIQTSIEEVANAQSRNFLEGIVLLTSILALIALIVKEHCAAVWFEYRSPLAFSVHLIAQERIEKGKKEEYFWLSNE